MQGKGGRDDRPIRFDCRRFLGDRPCPPHKERGVVCGACDCYAPISCRVLVIKLDSLGDVLRTTAILPGLKKQYGSPHVTWITRREAMDLLRDNPYIDRIVEYGVPALALLGVETFDLAINLDASQESSALATLARAGRKVGYELSPDGIVRPLNPEAWEWFEMGLFDDLKKRNSKTYPQIACEIVGVPGEEGRPVLCLSEEELAFGRGFAMEREIRGDRPLVGINTGGGGRWRFKRWTSEGLQGLIEGLRIWGVQTVLLGGSAEEELNRRLILHSGPGLIDGGCRNSLREFASLVDLCDLLVTGDSLALHIAVALKKKVVALFGPTSAAEIDLCGLGVKIVPPLDCLCCYRPSCDHVPTCMESIRVEEVLSAVKELL